MNRLYFVTTTFSSTGYGDISPKSQTARGITILLQLLVVINIISLLGKY